MQKNLEIAQKLLFGSGSDRQLVAQQFLTLLDEMPGGFLIYRADEAEEILFANVALLQIFGCDSFEEFRVLTNGSFRGFVHPDDLEPVEKSIWRQIRGSQSDLDYVEYRIIRKDGRVRWIEDYGHFVKSEDLGDLFYVFVTDATEKKMQQLAEQEALRSENALQEQRLHDYDIEFARRQELIAGLSIDYESIFYVDLDADRIHAYRLSLQAGELFHTDPPVRDYTGFVKEYVDHWVHPEDRALIADTLDPDHIRERLPNSLLIHVNYRLLRHYRTEYLQLRVVSVREQMPISQIVIGSRSVDEEIRSAMEQKEFLSNALSQAKSAVIAKNTFLSNMSHDMRTPLNAIMGFTELASRSADNPEKVHRYLDHINAASDQLLHLISNVLEIARIESGSEMLRLENCDLPTIADEVRTLLLPQAAAKNLTISLQTSGLKFRVVRCDHRKLEEILFHLVSNGIKYTGQGGTVAIRLEGDDRSFHFIVEDDGIGISRGFLDHIFEFFAREHNTTLSGVHGTGLGLPIVKSLTELLQGTVTVRSTPGKGSCFTVTIPFDSKDAPPPPEEEAEPAPDGPASGRSRKILVTEDNELNLEIATELLQDAGFEVDTASNGSIAVEKIRASAPGDYALVLMDIQMPVMDGCTAARNIRSLPNARLASIPIVALSANAFEEDKKHALESGMNAHLSKPIDIDSLVGLIHELID